ncbi:MAG: hypothetical protein DRJ43_06395 [Thermoprotei archaeon]|mgnify:CR=1 FL=1|nr:MAG: hypothetical protein DRJ43_06395 [Thermoprotei archaeon]
MRLTVERLILLVCALAVAILTLLLLQPWRTSAEYTIDYVRGKGEEVAEAIERGSPVRPTLNWEVERIGLTVVATIPREEPLRVSVEYYRLYTPAPSIEGTSIVRGSPPTKVFERFRRVSVYHMGDRVVVDPKPFVGLEVVEEYGRRVYIVEVVLFYIKGEPIVGSVLRLSNRTTTTYSRRYDYSGTSTIEIGGQVAFRLQVNSEDILVLRIIRENWIVSG